MRTRWIKYSIWLLAISLASSLGAVIQPTENASSAPESVSSTASSVVQNNERYKKIPIENNVGKISTEKSVEKGDKNVTSNVDQNKNDGIVYVRKTVRSTRKRPRLILYPKTINKVVNLWKGHRVVRVSERKEPSQANKIVNSGNLGAANLNQTNVSTVNSPKNIKVIRVNVPTNAFVWNGPHAAIMNNYSPVIKRKEVVAEVQKKKSKKRKRKRNSKRKTSDTTNTAPVKIVVLRNATHEFYVKNTALKPVEDRNGFFSVDLNNKQNIVGIRKLNVTVTTQHVNKINNKRESTSHTNVGTAPHIVKTKLQANASHHYPHGTYSHNNVKYYVFPYQNKLYYYPVKPVNNENRGTHQNRHPYPADSTGTHSHVYVNKIRNGEVIRNVTYSRDPSINAIINGGDLDKVLLNATNKTLPSIVVTKVNKVTKSNGNVNVSLETVVELETQYEYHKMKPGEVVNYNGVYINNTDDQSDGHNSSRIIRTRRNKTTQSTLMNVEVSNLNNSTSTKQRDCSRAKNPERCKQRQERKRKLYSNEMNKQNLTSPSPFDHIFNSTNIQKVNKGSKVENIDLKKYFNESITDIIYGTNKMSNSDGEANKNFTLVDKQKYSAKTSTKKKPSNQHIVNYAIGTNNNKKPIIHKVLTKWSDEPNFDEIKDSLEPVESSNTDKFNFDNEHIGSIDKNYNIDEATVSSSVSFGNENINKPSSNVQTIKRPSPSNNIQFDGDVFFLKPHPTLGYSPSNLMTEKPPSIDLGPFPGSGSNENVHINPLHDQYPSAVAITSRPSQHTTETYDSLTPTYTFSTNIKDSQAHDDKDSKPVGPSAIDCPTVFVSINNSLAAESKDGCADIHLVINTKLNSNNIFTADPQPQADAVENEPLGESTHSLLWPLAPVPVVPFGGAPVAHAVGPPIMAFAPAPLAADPGSFAIGEGAAAAGGAGGGAVPPVPAVPPAGGASGGRPPKGTGTHLAKPSNDDDDEFTGVTKWLYSAAKVFAWVSILNPFNFGLYSLLFAPLTIFAVGGVGLAALMTPWVWSGQYRDFDRNAKKVIYVNKKKPQWHWKWDDNHKSWNWVKFPSTRTVHSQTKDPRTDDMEIENNSPFSGITGTIQNTWSDVKQGVYDMFWDKPNEHRISKRHVNTKRDKRISDSKDSWKRRRK